MNQEDFRATLQALLAQAEGMGFSYVGLTAGTLHRRVGDYPGPDHRIHYRTLSQH